jgi:hypothetical protein
MRARPTLLFVIGLISILSMTSCQTDSRQQALATSESQLALRQIQTRAFDTTDRERMLRTIIATLQDLSFVVDKADAILGSVSSTKLNGYQLRMTVTVRPRGETQLLVRPMLNTTWSLWKIQSLISSSSLHWKNPSS